VHEGLEVQLCPREGELFVLCRSADRREKEKAMHERFVARMEKELEKVRASCEKHKCKKEVIDWTLFSQIFMRRAIHFAY